MSDLTAEERELLNAAPAEETRPRRGRPPRRIEEPAAAPAPALAPAQVRGPHTPVQFDDDGWASLPVQMRG